MQMKDVLQYDRVHKMQMKVGVEEKGGDAEGRAETL